MIRVSILLLGALFFGGISAWSIWLAATADGRWALLSVPVLGATAIFLAMAADEAKQ